MTKEVLANLKCTCISCNGTGISYCYDNDKGSICLNCLGLGYVIEDKVYKIDNEYYINPFKDILIKVVLFDHKKIIPNINFVSFHNPYQNDNPNIMIPYSQFLKKDFQLPSKDKCPLYLLSLLGINFNNPRCQYPSNHLECPNTIDCWDKINHPILKRSK